MELSNLFFGVGGILVTIGVTVFYTNVAKYLDEKEKSKK
jgi:hypothetical protein